MTRNDVTETIIATRIRKGLKWADIARKVGQRFQRAWNVRLEPFNCTTVRA